MNTWDNVREETESDHEATLDESCHLCGVTLRDHYDRSGNPILCTLKPDMSACTKCGTSTFARSCVCIECR